MTGVHKRRDTWVSTAADNNSRSGQNQAQKPADQDDLPKSFCPICQSFGFYNLLRERIYKPEEKINGQKPKDSENWLMCYVCGEIVPIVHAKRESELVGVKDVPDNIHDIRKLYIDHFIKPRSQTIRKNIKRIDRLSPEEEDTDLQNFLDKGNGRQLTNYYSSSTD